MLAGAVRRNRASGAPEESRQGFEGRPVVKKIVTMLAVGAAGFAVWRKLEADKAEQALWAEVTDPVK
jgi:hypothetical protein